MQSTIFEVSTTVKIHIVEDTLKMEAIFYPET
jgi:hypothetical protein